MGYNRLINGVYGVYWGSNAIRLLGCPAGSDCNDRDRKLVYFTYLRDV